MRQIRFKGLVTLANAVRRELGGPLTPARREALKKRVEESVGEVERVLRSAGLAETALPGPSRKALHLLRTLDWEGANVSEQAGAPKGEMRFSRLNSFLDRTVHALALAKGERELDAIHHSISTTSRRIEGSIEREGVGPERLSAATRSARGWLAFFAERGNLAAYFEALERSRAAMEEAAGALRYPRIVEAQFRPVKLLYRFSSIRGMTRVQLPTPMITFDEAGFGTLARMVATREGEERRRVAELMAGDAYQLVQAELEALGGIPEVVRGAHHDLGESFARVNAKYFGGEMNRPHLTWSRGFTGRKFGHYDAVRDTVMVSSTLDRKEVPGFVVDFLMYHELLHKKLGARWVNGRRYSHTSEFLGMERRFEGFLEAEGWLGRLARG